MCPGAVPGPSVGPAPSDLAGTEQEEDVATPEKSRPPSRAAVKSVGDNEEEEKRMLHFQLERNRRKLRHHLLPELVRRKAKEQERHSFCLHTQICRSSTNSGRSNMKARCRSKP